MINSPHVQQITRQALSDAVKAEWKSFLFWYEAKCEEFARQPDQQWQTNHKASPDHKRKSDLAEVARIEWFHRLSNAGLQADYWILSPDEQKTVSQILGFTHTQQSPPPTSDQPETHKKRNSRLVENAFGPAGWMKWDHDAKKSLQIAARPPRRAGPPATKPSAAPRGKSHGRSRSYSYGSPSLPAPAFMPHAEPFLPLYYVPSLIPTSIPPSFSFSEAESLEMHARLRPVIHKASEAKIIEFYKGLCDATIQYQRRFINASLALNLHHDRTKMEEVEKFARPHFENDVRSLAFRKCTEVKEIVKEEMVMVEHEFLKRRRELEERERKKWEAAVEAGEKKREFEEKKKGKTPEEKKGAEEKVSKKHIKNNQNIPQEHTSTLHDKGPSTHNKEDAELWGTGYGGWDQQENNGWGKHAWNNPHTSTPGPSAKKSLHTVTSPNLDYAARKRWKPVRQGSNPSPDNEILFNISNSSSKSHVWDKFPPWVTSPS